MFFRISSAMLVRESPGLIRTGLVECIECRDDLLAVLGVKVDVSKGIDQREVFGAQLFLAFTYPLGQLFSFVIVFLLNGLTDCLTDERHLAKSLGLSLIASNDADNLLCVRLQLGTVGS
jgi:hypothetical protein